MQTASTILEVLAFLVSSLCTCGGMKGKSINLSVRMMNSDANRFTLVFENENVVDFGSCPEFIIAVTPDSNQLFYLF